MNRRTFLPHAFVPMMAGSLARGAEVHYRKYAEILPNYLSALNQVCHQKRLARLAALTSAKAIEERQQYVRSALWKAIGGRPADTPLNAKITGGFERRGYRVENLIYESRPGFHIAANLYIPTAFQGPFPGVLFQMGHSLNGKAYASYQKCCQGLVRMGYLVLAFEPMGQGERTYYPKPDGNLTRLTSADEEHTLPGRQLLLGGSTSSSIQVWDAVRSLDYLASHPLVDPKRLASTGQSGGGTLTMFLAAVDDRLTTAAVSCGNTENIICSNFLPPGATDDAEQNLVDGGPLTIDRWDLFYPFAPKPMLCLAAARDFFGTYSANYMNNGREEFQRLASVYRTLGKPEMLAWEELGLPHGLTYAFRVRIYDWFNRWMKPAGARPGEPEIELEPEERLRCSLTGNVVRDFKGKTPLTLAREAATGSLDVTESTLKQVLRLDEPPARARFTIVSQVPAPRGRKIEGAEVSSAPGVWLPAWIFTPAPEAPAKPAVLIVESRGRASNWQEDGLYQTLADKGYFVCAADIRGVGDLRPQYSPGAQGYASSHVSEENYAWASLVLGKPMAGQRTTDILTLIAAMKSHPAAAGRRLLLAAFGSVTTPALFAAALNRDLDTVYLHRGLASYRTLLDKEYYTEPLANFVPGILNRFDLKEIARFAAPRKVIVSQPMDGAGQAGAITPGGNVEMRETGWDLAAFDAL